MREPQRFEVDGVTYELTPFGARQGRRVFARLTQTIGPALAAATKDTQDLEAAIGTLTKAVDPDLVDELCDACAPHCRVQIGAKMPELTPEVFDEHFAQRYVAMLQWLLACLRINFSDFLDGAKVGALLGGLQAPSTSQSPTKSTG